MTNLIVLNRLSDHVAQIKLNRPDNNNTIDQHMLGQLNETLKDLNEDDGLRVLILTGEGNDFSLGDDMGHVETLTGSSMKENYNHDQLLSETLGILDELNCLTIAGVQGRAYGNALGLVGCCDYVVSQKNSRFVCEQTKYGLMPAIISPYLVRSLGPMRTRRMLLSGYTMDADEAKYAGWVQETISGSDLESHTKDIAYRMARFSPTAVQATKYWFNHYFTNVQEDMSEQASKLTAQIRLSTQAQLGVTAYNNDESPEYSDD